MKSIRINIYIPELVYEINNRTYITGRSRDNGQNYVEVANMQSNDDEENRAQIMRSIDNAGKALIAGLSEYIKEFGYYTASSEQASDGTDTRTDGCIEESNLLSEQNDSSSHISYRIKVPDNFNLQAVPVIVTAIHRYIVNMAIADWYNMTSKADATEYINLAAANIEQIRDAIGKRLRPVRRTGTDDGSFPTIDIGTVTSIAPDGQASATLAADGVDSEGNPKYKLNLALPKGSKGDPGADGTNGTDGKDGEPGKDGTDGADGIDGKTPVIGIGTVTTVADAASASATLVADGTDESGNPKYKLNLALPKGSKGDPGADGTDGTDGKDGEPGKDGTDGADGIDGKTPVIGIGTVTTVADTASASATLVADGVDSEGNPKYKLNLSLPKGEKGLPGTGSGNVSADGTGLVKDKKYLFVPSSNDSTEGVFVEYTAPEAVTKAKRLETARAFRLRGGAASNEVFFDGTNSCILDVTKLDESYLVNGTKSGFFTTPVDVLMRDVGGHNALAYVNPDAITVEYSRDGGATWAEYVDTETATEAEIVQYTQNKKIFTSHRGASYSAQAEGARFYLGKADMSNRQTPQYQLRVTLDFHRTDIYARFIKSYINFGTGSATGNTVDMAWMPDGGTAWKAIATGVAINGWTGWNTISGFAIANHMASQSADANKARYMRWTFRTGGVAADSAYQGAWISNLFLISEANYSDSIPPMSRYGTVNDADCYSNMILPQSLKLEVPSGSAWTRQINTCASDNWQSPLGGMFFRGTGRTLEEITLLLAGKGLRIDSAGNVTMRDGQTNVRKIALPNGCYIEQSGTDGVKLGANEILLEQGDNGSAAFTGTYNGYRQGGMKTVYRSGTDGAVAVTYFYSNNGGIAIFNTGEVRFRTFMTDEDFYTTPQYGIDANWSTIDKVAKLVFAGGVEMIGGNPLMVVNAATGYVTLERGKLFVISGQTTIDISVPEETDGFAGEYNAEIVTGETAPTVSFPASLKWDGGETPAFEASKTYHIVIFRGVGYCSQGA